MGKFDYSLDLGKDLGIITESEKTPEVTNNNSFEKPQYLPHLNKTHIIMLILLLIIGFEYLTITDKLYIFDIQANLEADTQLKESITARKIQNNPLLTAQGLENEVRKEFDQVKKTSAFKEQVNDRAIQLKNWHKDISGQVYLYTVDAYYYYRMANQYVMWKSFNSPSAEGFYYNDPLRTSPRGETLSPTLLSYFTAYFYKLWSVLSNISVMTAAFYLPVIFGLLSIVCFFFIAHKLFNNDIITFCATLLFTLHQRFFVGNFAGNSDTQVLAFFFTMLTMLIFVYFIDFSNKVRSIILFLLFYPTLVLFSESWSPGWMYILVIIFGFTISYSVLIFVRGVITKEVNYYYLLLFFIPLFFTKKILDVLNLAMQRFNPKVVSASGERFIGELYASSFNSIIEALGGLVLVVFAFCVLLYLLYRNLSNPNKYEVFVITWFIPMLIAGWLSRRFTYFIAPSFCLLVGFGLYYTYPYLSKILEQLSLPVKKEYNKWIACVVLSLAILTLLSDDIFASREMLPEVNDAIAKTADFIQSDSNETALIFTGMNRGYVWQALAMRGTISDGANWGSVKEKELYIALTNDVEETYKKPFYLLSLDKGYPSVDLSFKDKNSDYWSKFIEELNKTKIETIFNEAFVVVDKDTFSALSRYYSIAREDWRKTTIRDYVFNNKNFEELNLTDEEKNYWLSKSIKTDDTSLALSDLNNCYLYQDKKLVCANNFVIDIDNLDAQQNNLHPHSLVVVKNDVRQEKVFSDGSGDFTIFVFEGNNGYLSFFVDKQLKDTLTARLYSGEKIKGFEQVHIEELPERIVTYKIVWS